MCRIGFLQKHPQVYGARCPSDSEPRTLAWLEKNMSKYFEFTKCFSITMSFYKGTQSNTFMIFRLKKRIGPKTGRQDKVSIVDESTSIFGYKNRLQALKKLKEEMWRKLSLGLQGRSLRHICNFPWLLWWVTCVTSFVYELNDWITR